MQVPLTSPPTCYTGKPITTSHISPGCDMRQLCLLIPCDTAEPTLQPGRTSSTERIHTLHPSGDTLWMGTLSRVLSQSNGLGLNELRPRARTVTSGPIIND